MSCCWAVKLVLFFQLVAVSISPYERRLSRSFVPGFDALKLSQLARILVV